MQLALGLRDGTDLAAAELNISPDGSLATARLPPLPGATGFDRADIALSDALGRTAFMYRAFTYETTWQVPAVVIVADVVVGGAAHGIYHCWWTGAQGQVA